MHANDEDTDIKHFGGLRRVMPITFLTTMIAWAAIIGVPLTGSLPKDPGAGGRVRTAGSAWWPGRSGC